MYYEKYLVPGNRGFSIVTGPTDILIQVLEEGVMLHEFKNEELVQERIIPELTAEKTAALQVLGVAEAGDVSECFFLGIKYACEEFLPALVGYVLQPPEQERTEAGVVFYSERKAITEPVDMTVSSTPGRRLVGGGHA